MIYPKTPKESFTAQFQIGTMVTHKWIYPKAVIITGYGLHHFLGEGFHRKTLKTDKENLFSYNYDWKHVMKYEKEIAPIKSIRLIKSTPKQEEKHDTK